MATNVALKVKILVPQKEKDKYFEEYTELIEQMNISFSK